MVATLSAWPWENLGPFKYLLYGPFLAKVLYSRVQEETTMSDNWCLHILIICALRAFIYQQWTSWSNMLFLTRNRRILEQGVDFKQIDNEWDWDNFLILQALISSMACYMFPSISGLPLWDYRGFVAVILLHMGVSEPLYYWIHKCFHGDYLLTNYHSLHHSSPVPQAFTGHNGEGRHFEDGAESSSSQSSTDSLSINPRSLIEPVVEMPMVVNKIVECITYAKPKADPIGSSPSPEPVVNKIVGGKSGQSKGNSFRSGFLLGSSLGADVGPKHVKFGPLSSIILNNKCNRKMSKVARGSQCSEKAESHDSIPQEISSTRNVEYNRCMPG